MAQFNYLKAVDQASTVIKSKLGTIPFPELALVLGSGFRSFTSELKTLLEIKFSDIPGFGIPSVEGHGSSLLIGKSGTKHVCVLTGRTHLYEGFSALEVTLPVRVLAALGVKKLLLTNASGSLDSSVSPGSVMILRDQINLTGQNCLVGAGQFGPLFLEMSNTYDRTWRNTILGLDSSLKRGVYAGVLGPTYETPAEAALFKLLGATAIGMSMVQEAIAARHSGMIVAGISLITNMAGSGSDILGHAEVLESAERQKTALASLLKRTIEVS